MESLAVLTLHVRNYRALRDASLSFSPGISVLVGPNGTGKTTLLRVGMVIREAFCGRGLASGIETWAGLDALKYLGAAPEENIQLSISLEPEGLRWEGSPVPVQGGIAPHSAEAFWGKNDLLWYKKSGTIGKHYSDAINLPDPTSASEALAGLSSQENYITSKLNSWALFGDYSISQLRQQGSPISSQPVLLSNGINVFSLLRTWRDRRADLFRYELVVEGLRECFPFFDGLDFAATSQIVSAEIVHRGFNGKTSSVQTAANGWFIALLHLCALASAEEGGIVCIDEFENALHPYAIHTLLDFFQDYIASRQISVLLTTHSPSVLDWFEQSPERVLVLQGGSNPGPVALTELRDPAWLSQFRLGRLFQAREFGGGL